MGDHHEAGVVWHRHPIPPRAHRCFPASTYEHLEGIMQRCPCGAARYQSIAVITAPLTTPRWTSRNSRRASPENRKPYRRPAWLRLLKRLGL